MWVCSNCALKYDSKMPDGHIATFHMDTCDVCGTENAEVTEDRDYGRDRMKLIRAYEGRINPKK